MITLTRYTDLSVRTLKGQFEQLSTAIAKQEQLLTNEIMIKKNSDVTAEQLQEFKDGTVHLRLKKSHHFLVFKHFDKDGNGTLQRKELKACLQSLGEEPSVRSSCISVAHRILKWTKLWQN